jgi:hypothetical protein
MALKSKVRANCMGKVAQKQARWRPVPLSLSSQAMFFTSALNSVLSLNSHLSAMLSLPAANTSPGLSYAAQSPCLKRVRISMGCTVARENSTFTSSVYAPKSMILAREVDVHARVVNVFEFKNNLMIILQLKGSTFARVTG